MTGEHETPLLPAAAVDMLEQVAVCRRRLREAEELLKRALLVTRWDGTFPVFRAEVAAFLGMKED
jgi:hypothetical protein